MSAVNARPGKALLTRKVSHCDYLLAFVAIAVITGCQMTSAKISALAPNSTVIAQAVGTNATQKTWLESATISYARHFTHTKAEKNVWLANFNPNSPTKDTLQVLAIRYPHPDGHKDRARVELVIADPSNSGSKNSWYRRLGKTLDDTLPGIVWGEGIQKAMALDLPVGDLRQLLVEYQNSVVPVTVTAVPSTQVQLVSEINGQYNETKSAPIPALEKLASRVEQQGKLVAYSGSASELIQHFSIITKTQQVDMSVSPSATETNPRLALFPLPPVNLR